MELRPAGYTALAAAVIEQAVHDLKRGDAYERRQAASDIRGRGLEWWIDMLAERYDVYDSINARIARLLRGYAA